MTPSADIGKNRLAVRLAVFGLTLLVVDVVVSAALPRPDYTNDWRLPRDLPTSQLADFVNNYDRSVSGDGPCVAFVGSSPTWGDAVRHCEQTVPAAYRRRSAASGSRADVYNFASNGQLVGDMYFVARRVAQDTDLLFVQLTYHGFNREWRQDLRMRYPEIPSLLGVPVNREVAAVLDIPPSRRPDVTGKAERWLAAHWGLYGKRDAIASKYLGATPEIRIFEAWESLALPDFIGDEDIARSGAPFEQLDPDVQMLMLDEFAQASDYRITETDSEVRMLEALASELEASGVRTVFYVSPMNVEALESYDLMDPSRYSTNVGMLRGICEKHGHVFLDLNSDAAFPSYAFADISHTTAEGSDLVAAELCRRTGEMIGAVP